ncbi:hypothetical protein COC69_01185 [Bacillus cereus]|uniref:Uncharacterized protein n=1 Tax=Bacillus cereus TaxID=1396 RepID=A0A9X7CSI5_BACCE|nr:hypothetical protein COC69_01185 [Bacillus cereus]
MNKVIMGIMLSIGVIISLGLQSQIEPSKNIYKSDKTNQVTLSDRTVTFYGVTDPRRGLGDC